MPVLANWREDDDSGERYFSRITRCTGKENDLWPQAPKGWWAVYRYDSTSLPVDPRYTAGWLLCVFTAQHWEHRHGRERQRHMISRTPDGDRILIVHPELKDELDQCVETINAHFNGYGSNCGGWTTLEPELQAKAALVFARRACAKIPLSRVAEILDQLELAPELLLEPGWLDQLQGFNDSIQEVILESDVLHTVAEWALDNDPVRHLIRELRDELPYDT